jgi:hypothetical protein
MVLKFSGMVVLGDAYRCMDDGDPYGAIHIGGRDFVDEIASTKFAGPVTVGIADERFDGDLSVDTGWGYSEVTPEETDRLHVGPHNIIDRLERLEGQNVTVWVADEPVNVLE